jgi:hypothetical protein
MTAKMKNTRSLDAIANDIHAAERRNIFEVGDFLLEAMVQCKPGGEWLAWVESEFEWSVDSAGRYAAVAELGTRFRKLRNLKLAKTTLYELTKQDDADQPAIITELAKHATKSRLAPRDARRVIQIGIARRRFGDHPDATLFRLSRLDWFNKEQAWYPQAVAALKEQQPTTDAAADEIVHAVCVAQAAAEAAAEDNEAAAILEDPPPALPPATNPSKPYKIQQEWANPSLAKGPAESTEQSEPQQEEPPKKYKRDTSISFDTIVRTVGEIYDAAVQDRSAYDARRLHSFFTALEIKAANGLALPQCLEVADEHHS